MEFVDFKQNEKSIYWQISHSNEKIDVTNDRAIFDYYKFLNFFRHNYLHYLVLKMLGKDWEDEKRIIDIVGENISGPYSNKTPDIFLKKDDRNYFIDVSISYDIHKTEKTKKEKYEPMCVHLTTMGFLSTFYHINVSNDDQNIQTEIEKIIFLSTRDFDYLDYFRMKDIIIVKKKWVSDHMNKETFEKMKQQEYNTISDSNNTKELLFKDRLSRENMGIYNDINIDVAPFKEFNDKFKHITEIEENYKEYNDDDISDYLKEILEDAENPINIKYKDEILTNKQFETALENIMESNKKKNKIEPKPTHHLLIPYDDDYNQTNNEQQSIIEFAKNFLKDISQLTGLEKK